MRRCACIIPAGAAPASGHRADAGGHDNQNLSVFVTTRKDYGLAVLIGEKRYRDAGATQRAFRRSRQEMFQHAAKLGWEGIVSKSKTAPNRSARTEGWLKIKTV
jgi:hypothetical protein